MRSSDLRDTGVLLLGAGVGAGLMYLLDPHGGAHRRAIIRDKVISIGKDAIDQANRRSHDAIQRARGQQYEIRHRGEHVDDDTLTQRARAQLGHVVSHPGVLEIEAAEGCVIVRGPVLCGERRKIEERLRKTRGAQSFDLSGVQEMGAGENIDGLQGQSARRRVGI